MVVWLIELAKIIIKIKNKDKKRKISKTYF